jgi:hypothetical protein
MNRRGFLRGMMGLGGAIIAGPAIVRAESLMKIVAPPKEIILPGLNALAPDYDGDIIYAYYIGQNGKKIDVRTIDYMHLLNKGEEVPYVPPMPGRHHALGQPFIFRDPARMTSQRDRDNFLKGMNFPEVRRILPTLRKL